MNSKTKNNKEILPLIERRILEIFGNKVMKILLFGSYAREDFNEESDIDIIVIVDDIEIDRYKKLRVKIISEFSLNYDLLLSIRVLRNEDFSKYKDSSPFLKNVVKEGISFYG